MGTPAHQPSTRARSASPSRRLSGTRAAVSGLYARFASTAERDTAKAERAVGVALARIALTPMVAREQEQPDAAAAVDATGARGPSQ
jgi:hypothetical protein